MMGTSFNQIRHYFPHLNMCHMLGDQAGSLASQALNPKAGLQDVHDDKLAGTGDNPGEAMEPDDTAHDLMHDFAVALRTLKSGAPNRSEAAAVKALLGLVDMATRTPVTIHTPVTTRSGCKSRQSAKYSDEEYVDE